MLTLAPQNRHRPRLATQLSTGTSWSGPSTWLHEGHRERPRAHDSPRGSRHDSVVTALPKIAPSIPRVNPNNVCGTPPFKFTLLLLERCVGSVHNTQRSRFPLARGGCACVSSCSWPSSPTASTCSSHRSAFTG